MISFFQHLFPPDFEWLFEQYGIAIYSVLFLIIFIETGLVIMPFLPGDSLLFAAGMFAATGNMNLALVLILLIVAAIFGDNLNYWIGRKVGLKVLNWKIKGRVLVKREYLQQTETFFDKYGSKAIIMARFIPFIRTFTPFAAGVGKMKFQTFFLYDVIGGILWICSMTLLGYFLGGIPWVKENISKVVLLIIGISIAPVLWKLLLSKWKSRKQNIPNA
jgi:membrane-associated protein